MPLSPALCYFTLQSQSTSDPVEDDYYVMSVCNCWNVLLTSSVRTPSCNLVCLNIRVMQMVMFIVMSTLQVHCESLFR